MSKIYSGLWTSSCNSHRIGKIIRKNKLQTHMGTCFFFYRQNYMGTCFTSWKRSLETKDTIDQGFSKEYKEGEMTWNYESTANGGDYEMHRSKWKGDFAHHFCCNSEGEEDNWIRIKDFLKVLLLGFVEDGLTTEFGSFSLVIWRVMIVKCTLVKAGCVVQLTMVSK